MQFNKKLTVWAKRPLHQKIFSLLNKIVDPVLALIEKMCGYNFCNDAPIHDPISKNHHYQKGSAVYLVKYIWEVEKKEKHNIFIDIGCGKGRLLLYAKLTKKFNKVIGIDVSNELIMTAKKNFEGTDVETYAEDATSWLLPNEKCLIYMFNPFNETILKKFLERNLNHFENHNSTIIYHRDIYSSVLEKLGFIKNFSQYGYQTSFFKFKSLKNNSNA